MSAASNGSREALYKTLCVAAISLVVVLTAGSLLAQDTDLQFHKFHPQATSQQPATATSQQAAAPSAVTSMAVQQMQAMQVEKAMRTPAQQKIDSNILFTIRMLAGQPAVPSIPYLDTGVDLDRNDNMLVDMVANVTDQLLSQLAVAGAQVLYVNRELRSIRAILPPSQMEWIASSPDVIFISRKQGSMTEGARLLTDVSPWLRWSLAPEFEKRAANLRRQQGC